MTTGTLAPTGPMYPTGPISASISSLAAGHLTLLPALKQALADHGRPDIMIVIGGVIPPDDVPTLMEMGAAAVFLPGTPIADSALDLLARLREQHAG